MYHTIFFENPFHDSFLEEKRRKGKSNSNTSKLDALLRTLIVSVSLPRRTALKSSYFRHLSDIAHFHRNSSRRDISVCRTPERMLCITYVHSTLYCFAWIKQKLFCITEVCACRYVGLECWPYRECRKESLGGFFLDRLEKLQYFDMGIWRQTWISSIFCQYQQKFTLPPIPHTLLKYIACDILRYHFFHLHLRRQSHLFGIELNRNLSSGFK